MQINNVITDRMRNTTQSSALMKNINSTHSSTYQSPLINSTQSSHAKRRTFDDASRISASDTEERLRLIHERKKLQSLIQQSKSQLNVPTESQTRDLNDLVDDDDNFDYEDYVENKWKRVMAKRDEDSFDLRQFPHINPYRIHRALICIEKSINDLYKQIDRLSGSYESDQEITKLARMSMFGNGKAITTQQLLALIQDNYNAINDINKTLTNVAFIENLIESDDFDTWIQVEGIPPNTNINSIASNGYSYIAVGDGIYMSIDGKQWKPYNLEQSCQSVCYGNNLYLILDSTGNLYSSPDSTIKLSLIASVHNIKKIKFVGELFYIFDAKGIVRVSKDTETWEIIPDLIRMNDVAYGVGKYIIVGDAGKYAYSFDGINFTINQDNYFTGIMQTKSLPELPVILSSTGIHNIIEIVYGNNRFVIIDNDGEVCHSSDGINWVKSGISINDKLTTNIHIKYHECKSYSIFLIHGEFNGIFVSYDGMYFEYTELINTSIKITNVVNDNIILGNNDKVFYSNNGGKSWNEGLVDGVNSANCLSTVGGMILYGTNSGIYYPNSNDIKNEVTNLYGDVRINNVVLNPKTNINIMSTDDEIPTSKAVQKYVATCIDDIHMINQLLPIGIIIELGNDLTPDSVYNFGQWMKLSDNVNLQSSSGELITCSKWIRVA